jgi:hypothetical protein
MVFRACPARRWNFSCLTATLHVAMSISVACHSCGKSLSVPDDYNRRKVRCPDCGVYCELPEERKSERTPAARPTVKPAGTRSADDFPVSTKPAAPTVAPPKKPASCPTAPVPPPRVTEDEDSETYSVTPTNEIHCPGCDRELTEGTTVCGACGYDLQAGKKPAKVYESRTWKWEAGMPFHKRRNIFIALQILPLVVGVPTAVMSGAAATYVTSWFTGALLLAFLLGTFARVDLSRGKRGQVRLSKTWRICFIPLQTEMIPWREYEGIALGKVDDTDMFDWFMLLAIFSSGSAMTWPLSFALEWPARAILSLICGIVVDVLWWYFVIRRVSFYVALCKNHAYPELMLYRGWSEEMMSDMGSVIREATDLPNLSSGEYG